MSPKVEHEIKIELIIAMHKAMIEEESQLAHEAAYAIGDFVTKFLGMSNWALESFKGMSPDDVREYLEENGIPA